MILIEVLLPPDTRANQPLASDVPPGSLYSVTDEDNLIEQSDGTVWVRYGGSSPATTGTSGVLNAQTSATGIGNSADTLDAVLFTYTLPANRLAADGDSVRVIATGHFAANSNDKLVKPWFAGNAISDAVLTGGNDVDWVCELEIVRIDATHVSARGELRPYGLVAQLKVFPNLVVADLTATASVIEITGASPTTGAANDVLGYLMKTVLEN